MSFFCQHYWDSVRSRCYVAAGCHPLCCCQELLWVTRSSSLHSMVSLGREDDVRLASFSLLSSCRRGNKVPMTLASKPGSMFAVSGGGGRSQLLRDQSVRPSPRVGFDRLDQFHSGPGFRDLDLLLKSASLLPVVLVVVGNLSFVAAAADVVSLAATAAAEHPCVPSVVANSRKGILFLIVLLVFGGVHAVTPILWLTLGCGGETFYCTVSTSVAQVPSFHSGHACGSYVSQLQAFVALERPLWDRDDPRGGPSQGYFPCLG
jgi:hypothetical protein